MTKFFSIIFPVLGLMYGIIGIRYEISKIALIFNYGGTHVALETIVIVYVTSVLASIASVFGIILNKENKAIKIIAWLGTISTLAVLVAWASLNLGGFIISHDAMFKGKLG